MSACKRTLVACRMQPRQNQLQKRVDWRCKGNVRRSLRQSKEGDFKGSPKEGENAPDGLRRRGLRFNRDRRMALPKRPEQAYLPGISLPTIHLQVCKKSNYYLCIKRFISRYCMPSQIWTAKSHNVSTGKLDRNDGSLRHSSKERKGASSVTSIKLPVSSTTPNKRTMCGWSMECMMAASFRNSIVLVCMRSRARHLIATWNQHNKI